MFGWVLVAAYEAYAIARRKETMSSAFWKALRTKHGVPILTCAWIVLTKHLFGHREWGC